MKKLIALIIFTLLMMVTIAFSSTALLSWEEVTTNTDGTLCTDLAGYRIYYGFDQGGPYPYEVDVGDTLSASIDGEWEGQRVCFVATAYDLSDNESDYSNEVCKDFPQGAPQPPILSLQ